jgi:fatty-acid desaturase
MKKILSYFHYHTWLIILPLYLMFLYSLTQYANYNIWYFLSFIISWTLIGGFGLELGLHRFFSHGAFKCSRFTEIILGLLGILSLNGSPIFWKSIHVAHHRYTDTDKDPHSPTKGGWNSYLGWIVSKDSIANVKVAFAGKKLLEDKFHLFLHKHQYSLIWLSFILIFLINDVFFWLCFIPAVFLSFNQGLLVNYFCHNSYGYSNFELDNDSKNIKWLSYVTFGLALHNNHHKYPNNLNFACTKNEYDLGYYLSKCIVKHD